MNLPTPTLTKEKVKLTYFREVQQELVKVSWTNKEELILCTKIVVGSTLVFSLGVYCTDFIIRNVLNLIGFLARIIG